MRRDARLARSRTRIPSVADRTALRPSGVKRATYARTPRSSQVFFSGVQRSASKGQLASGPAARTCLPSRDHPQGQRDENSEACAPTESEPPAPATSGKTATRASNEDAAKKRPSGE